MIISWTTVLYLLFHLTMFALLVMQLVQLVTAYLLPPLRRSIAQLEQFWVDQDNKITLLSTTKKKLTKKIEIQTKQLENFEKKITLWHNSLLEKQKIRETAHIEQLEALSQKKQEQYKKLMTIQKEIAILPQAIAQARVALQEKYSGKNGKEILTQVIERLGR